MKKIGISIVALVVGLNASFLEDCKTCRAGADTTATVEMFGKYVMNYHIDEMSDKGCVMTVTYIEAPVPEFTGKKMTGTFTPGSFESLESITLENTVNNFEISNTSSNSIEGMTSLCNKGTSFQMNDIEVFYKNQTESSYLIELQGTTSKETQLIEVPFMDTTDVTFEGRNYQLSIDVSETTSDNIYITVLEK